MRWSALVPAVAFGLLSSFRFVDGQPVWGALFALAAVAYLYWALRPLLPGPAGGRGQGDRAREQAPDLLERPLPSPAELRRALETYQSQASGWLWIVLAGWAAAVFGLWLFPPMGLVVSAIALYATVRYRRTRQGVRALSELLARRAPTRR